MTDLGDELKRIVLAGIGAIAITAEKSHELVEMLVKKGELTVEQGKAINEELKRKRQETKEAQKEQDHGPGEAGE